MAYSAMSLLTALIMALSTLLSPAGGASGYAQPKAPLFSLSIDANDRGDYAFALTETPEGAPIATARINGDAFYLTGETAALTVNGTSFTVSTPELLEAISGAMGMLPQPSQTDLMALLLVAQDVMHSVSPTSFSFTPRGEGFNVFLDVDALLSELDAAVPKALRTYAALLDPMLQKYASALLGMPLTTGQLAQLWPQLGLKDVHTGLTLTLTIVPSPDGTVVMGAAAGFTFVARISETDFSLRFSTPDGTIYPFDASDFKTLADVFGDLPQQIWSRCTTYDSNPERPGYTITIDSSVMAGYLNDGISRAIASNAATVDQLLTKYQPWLALIAPDIATMDAAALAAWLSTAQPIQLPQVTGYFSKHDTRLATIIDSEFTGFFGTLTLAGSLQRSRGYGDMPATLTLTLNDGYNPLIATLNLSTSGDDRLVTAHFSQPVFGLFSTLTFRTQVYGHEMLAITTDTDVFRFIISEGEQYLEAKAGPVSFLLRETANDAWQMNFSMPQFFADVHLMGDAMRLDSTYLGLDVSRSDNAFIFSGYFRPDEYERYDFGLNVQPAHGFLGPIVSGYLTGNDTNMALSYVNERFYLTVDDELYSIVPDSDTDAILFCHNFGIVATLYGDVTDTTLTLRLYEGYVSNGSTAEPICTVVLDREPDPVALPAGAQATDAAAFLELLNSLID